MTTVTLPTSSLPSFSTVAITADSAPISPPTPVGPLNVSNAWLLSWAVGRSGFPSAIAIGSDTVPKGAHGAPLYGVHLTRQLPVTTLLRAMSALKGRNAAKAVLFMVDEGADGSYREHLHLDKNQQVLGIRRKFWKHGDHKQRPRIAGIAWRLGGSLTAVSAPLVGHDIGSCWRTIRALLNISGKRDGANSVIRQIILPAPLVRDFRSDLIAQLPPASLRALATDLDYRTVRDFCFAHPHAVIAENALLRGPLFIDGDAMITADQIHFGPGWVSRHSPSLTLPESGHEEDHAHAAVSRPWNPTSNRDYFIGPKARRRPFYNFFKREFDIAFALFALLVTLPICLAVALIIKLYDRGPVFFIHKREGRDGKPFGCLKFRTMVRDAEALKLKLRKSNLVDGPQFKMADDPRITPVGRFLRKSNIDELPQFINVLRGEMSIVGPRPSPFEENQLCPGWREARLSIKPGITGLWQISRSRNRGAADFQEWIFFDTQYVDRRGFWLDMRIVLLTIKEMFGQGQ